MIVFVGPELPSEVNGKSVQFDTQWGRLTMHHFVGPYDSFVSDDRKAGDEEDEAWREANATFGFHFGLSVPCKLLVCM